MKNVAMLMAHNLRTGVRYLVVRTIDHSDSSCCFDVFILNENGEASEATLEERNDLLTQLECINNDDGNGNATLH